MESHDSDSNAELRSRKHTYANENAYFLPNDTPEQQRLNEQALAIEELLGNRISLAPLSSPTPKIIDIGCGTGSTTRTFAVDHPSGEIHGIDLSSIASRPDDPANLTYHQGDIRQLAGQTDTLAYSSFDLAFSRLLVFGMTDWPAYFAHLARLVRPGGYVECQEVTVAPMWLHEDESGRVTMPSPLRHQQAMAEAAAAKGLDLGCASKLAEMMRAAGLEVVVEKAYRWPLGEWAAERGEESTRRIGRVMVEETIPVAVHGALGAICKGVRTDEEIEVLQRELLEHCAREQDGVYTPYYVVVGRRLEE